MSKTKEQKRARAIQKETEWSYSECLRLARENVTDEALKVMIQIRGKGRPQNGKNRTDV